MNLVAGRLRRELLDQRVTRLFERLNALSDMTELLHPDRPLERGFVRVTDRAGRTLTRAADATVARDLRLRFGDGAVDAVVGAGAPPVAPVERKRRATYMPAQAGLFDQPEE
jgi:exodeoxyribonuclease VII large subunit